LLVVDKLDNLGNITASLLGEQFGQGPHISGLKQTLNLPQQLSLFVHHFQLPVFKLIITFTRPQHKITKSLSSGNSFAQSNKFRYRPEMIDKIFLVSR
jgi:hypothetical protein